MVEGVLRMLCWLYNVDKCLRRYGPSSPSSMSFADAEGDDHFFMSFAEGAITFLSGHDFVLVRADELGSLYSECHYHLRSTIVWDLSTLRTADIAVYRVFDVRLFRWDAEVSACM